MLEKICGIILILGGVAGSLIAWRLMSLENWVSPRDLEQWHDKYGKIVRIAGPVVVVIGLLFLFM